MAIDPEILKQMQVDDVQSDGDGPVQPEMLLRDEPTGPEDKPKRSSTLPALWGSEKQIKWATTIREAALAQDWDDLDRDVLVKVGDASWWIANRYHLSNGEYAKPGTHQLELGGKEPQAAQMAEPFKPDPKIKQAVASFQRQLNEEAAASPAQRSREERLSDAAKWAASVSQHPQLAEAAILAVLSRLYNGDMRKQLKARAERVLNNAQAAIEKDADAIFKMLDKN